MLDFLDLGDERGFHNHRFAPQGSSLAHVVADVCDVFVGLQSDQGGGDLVRRQGNASLLVHFGPINPDLLRGVQLEQLADLAVSDVVGQIVAVDRVRGSIWGLLALLLLFVLGLLGLWRGGGLCLVGDMHFQEQFLVLEGGSVQVLNGLQGEGGVCELGKRNAQGLAGLVGAFLAEPADGLRGD